VRGYPKPANSGRKKGSRNRRTLAAALKTYPDALDHLASVVAAKDDTTITPDLRLRAAIGLAAYQHPKPFPLRETFVGPIDYAAPKTVDEARAAMRRDYDEDRWLGQKFYPVLIEKDTMEPVCRPTASRWQMSFASSRGYGSLTLQHDVAQMLNDRYARTGQTATIYFISDLDLSGLDLQQSWEEALDNFGIHYTLVRIGLTRDQVRDNTDIRGLPLERLGIGVKNSHSRAASYIRRHGAIRWEADILPGAVIEAALDAHIGSWLDHDLWAAA
jgi:hypothetical protein